MYYCWHTITPIHTYYMRQVQQGSRQIGNGRQKHKCTHQILLCELVKVVQVRYSFLGHLTSALLLQASLCQTLCSAVVVCHLDLRNCHRND